MIVIASSQKLSATADASGASLVVSELEWLLRLASAGKGGASERPAGRPERLAELLEATVQHLECVVGALLLPAQGMRLESGAVQALGLPRERLVAELEQPVLSAIRRTREPMLVSRGRAASSQPLRLLAVGIGEPHGDDVGALLLIRPAGAPAFNPMHVAIARHVSRLASAASQASRDPATGLLTRIGLQSLLGRSGSPSHATGGRHALLSLRVDRLDIINRTKGFETGDAVIGAIAGVLRSSHVPDGALAARVSGNEFALVLPSTEPEQAERTAELILRLTAPVTATLVGSRDPISVSCGIASFSTSGDFEMGLAHAQLACRTARRHGRGRIEVYRDTDASMIQPHTDILAVQLLREALRENRFTLFAQRIMPLREARTGQGYELLLRSADELGENRAPLHLLSAAHRNHLAPAVDLWVMEHALAEAAPFRRDLQEANVALSINITGPSLTDQAFLERARRLIEQSRIDPQLITFEITETVAVLSLARAVAFIRELRALGCRFALDDFGTGVNSLKNLTSLPVDRVKIDGSFVADLLTNRQSQSMVRAIVSLARDLGIGTVAEYAENREIIERLRELGVECAQGYGVAMPRAFADVLQEVRRQGAGESLIVPSNDPPRR
jgi:diguanylate cyclase (GGDEF)-like protein